MCRHTELGNRSCPSLPNEIRDKPDICPTQRTFHNAYKLHCLPSLTLKLEKQQFQSSTRTVCAKKRHSNPGWDPNHERYGEIETIETSPLRMLTFLTNFLVMTRWTSHTIQDLVPRVELGQLNVIFSQTSYKPAAAKSSSRTEDWPNMQEWFRPFRFYRNQSLLPLTILRNHFSVFSISPMNPWQEIPIRWQPLTELAS